jgi:competence protein ComEC
MDRKNLVLALVFLLYSAVAFAGGVNVVFLDVGEGEAVYVETPEGERVLVDAGNLMSGYRVLDYLTGLGVEELDAIIITHPHPDHMGGVFHLLPRLKVKARYDNGQPLGEVDGGDVQRWYGDIFRRGNYTSLRAGDRLLFGALRMDVLSPRGLTPGCNRNSLVIRATYGDTSFLLMGDAGATTEETLLQNGAPLDADVLKMGHHGAAGSSLGGFLDAVSPEYAVLSIDEANVRGYPDEDVMRRFRERGIKLGLTFREGNIAFESDGSAVRRLKPSGK